MKMNKLMYKWNYGKTFIQPTLKVRCSTKSHRKLVETKRNKIKSFAKTKLCGCWSTHQKFFTS